MQHEPRDEEEGGWKTWFWVAVCCVPMIAIIVLISLAYWGPR
jgi:hypothetical protein